MARDTITEKQRDERMAAILDAGFLAKLAEVGRLYGWSGDYCEIGGFIESLHMTAGVGITREQIEPYDIE